MGLTPRTDGAVTALNIVDGISRANIEAAGNPWDVNLSGEVSLVTGAYYTIVFDAKGTDGRTLLAGIGDTSEPYANNTNVIRCPRLADLHPAP